MLWFIADTHFGHKNIIGYCSRPFGSVGQMDDALIERWNERVQSGDTVYMLGDFCLGDIRAASYYAKRLMGDIVFITSPTHHDKRWCVDLGLSLGTMETMSGVATVSPSGRVEVLGRKQLSGYGDVPAKVVLCHNPFAVWEDKHYGSWHLHGHVHSDWTPGLFSMNVSVEATKYAPVSLVEVHMYMEERGWHLGWKEFDDEDN